MKQLLILRHAKASPAAPGLADIDRPLAKRGLEAAPLMGREMRRRGWLPERVLCSAAQRARATWEGAAAMLEAAPEAALLRSLYMAPPSRLLQEVRGTPADVDRLLLIGHNPGLQRFAERLAGPGSDRKALARLREKLPTAGLACFEAEVDTWRDLRQSGARLVAFLRPNDVA